MVKYIKQGDAEPYIRATLGTVRDNVRSLVDLTGSSVKFIMRKNGQLVPAIEETLSGGEIVDAANGQVQYEWRSGNTDEQGDYQVEFEVTYSGGNKLTFWDLRTLSQISNDDYPIPLKVSIISDLN